MYASLWYNKNLHCMDDAMAHTSLACHGRRDLEGAVAVADQMNEV